MNECQKAEAVEVVTKILLYDIDNVGIGLIRKLANSIVSALTDGSVIENPDEDYR